MNEVSYFIDIRTSSEANARGYWAKTYGLHKDQKFLAGAMTRTALSRLSPEHPLRQDNALINIKLTRIAPRSMDSDNIPSATKYIRDAIADVLAPGLAPGRADGLTRFSWTYSQRQCKGHDSKVEVTLSLYEMKLENEVGLIRKFTKGG